MRGTRHTLARRSTQGGQKAGLRGKAAWAGMPSVWKDNKTKGERGAKTSRDRVALDGRLKFHPKICKARTVLRSRGLKDSIFPVRNEEASDGTLGD